MLSTQHALARVTGLTVQEPKRNSTQNSTLQAQRHNLNHARRPEATSSLSLALQLQPLLPTTNYSQRFHFETDQKLYSN